VAWIGAELGVEDLDGIEETVRPIVSDVGDGEKVLESDGSGKPGKWALLDGGSCDTLLVAKARVKWDLDGIWIMERLPPRVNSAVWGSLAIPAGGRKLGLQNPAMLRGQAEKAKGKVYEGDGIWSRTSCSGDRRIVWGQRRECPNRQQRWVI